MIKLYNSLSGKVEEFKPIEENKVKMYVCGSTVYNGMHIGNSRPVIFFDVLSRFFKYMGYNVTFVSNFTDIDDKIIKKAIEENVTEKEISTRYINLILGTYKKLNCLAHDYNPKVTETMDEIIDFIKLLVSKDKAYVVNKDVYFDVSSVSDYGVLSGQTLDNLMAGARIEENDKKHSPFDFNLWKETDLGVKWPSCFGEGRPGWHTECVVMIDKIFHGPIDIHGGGFDLKFPHHENERAQSLAAYGHALANYWMHTGWIAIDNVKMSKSIGNTVDCDELVSRLGYGVYRVMMLSAPYRQMINYQATLLDASVNQYEKIKRAFDSLVRFMQINYGRTFDTSAFPSFKDFKNENFRAINLEFENALSDDMNISNAFTAIDKIIKITNAATRQKNLSEDEMVELYHLFYNTLWVLGIEDHIMPLSEEDLGIVRNWNEARSAKDYEKADYYRNLMNEKGIIL